VRQVKTRLEFIDHNLQGESTMPYTSFESREEAAHAAWCEYCKSGQKPDNVPSNPDEVYKDSWISWCDWLGWNTESVN
jgi:hypothetical protein